MAPPSRSTRSYRQHCGLAAALDATSSRWTMLIVRDLAPGPRRFTDLFDALPGISTDLLADRLRTLTEAGAVRRRRIDSPVPGTVYELTDRGRELAAIAGRLARWGMALLPPIGESELRTNARWAIQSMAANYTGGAFDGAMHLTIDGSERLTIELAGTAATVAYGHLSPEPVLEISTTTEGFFDLCRAPLDTEADLPDGVAVTGRIELLAPLLAAMPIRLDTAAP